jgi:hypothetical protein
MATANLFAFGNARAILSRPDDERSPSLAETAAGQD